MSKKFLLVLRMQKLSKYNFRLYGSTTTNAFNYLMGLKLDEVEELYKSINK